MIAWPMLVMALELQHRVDCTGSGTHQGLRLGACLKKRIQDVKPIPHHLWPAESWPWHLDRDLPEHAVQCH